MAVGGRGCGGGLWGCCCCWECLLPLSQEPLSLLATTGVAAFLCELLLTSGITLHVHISVKLQCNIKEHKWNVSGRACGFSGRRDLGSRLGGGGGGARGLLCLCSLQLPVNTSCAPSSGLISLPQEVAVGAVSCSGALLNPIPSSNPAQGWLLQALLSTEQHMTTPASHPCPRSPSHRANKESVRKSWALSQIPAAVALPSASSKHFHLLPEGWAETAENPVWAKSGLAQHLARWGCFLSSRALFA